MKKRSKFWTLIFSLIPGAGEMYLGFMKNGFSIMILFFGYIMVCGMLGMEVMLFLLPAFWFYSFFHVHNLAKMVDEEFEQIEDKPIAGVEILNKIDDGLHINHSIMKLLGIGLIIIGVKEILQNVLSMIGNYIDSWLYWDLYYMITDQFMSIIIGGAIIWLGVYLMRGKRVKLEKEEE